MSRLTLSSALASCVVVMATVAPAAAAELRVDDARGDVWVSTDATAAAASPESTLGDVTWTKVRYAGARIVVRIGFRDLARKGAYAQYALRLQNRSTKMVREVVLEASPDSWGGTVRVFKPHGDLVTGCAVSHEIDYAADAVLIKVGRSCLHRPGAVRANVNAYRADGSGAFSSDNALTDDDSSGGWTAWVRRG